MKRLKCWKIWEHKGWGYPDVLQFRGTVLPTCFPVLFFSTIFTTLVAVAYIIFDLNIVVPGTLIDAVAVVVGLLLAIRTDKAYDKYYEGRSLFCSMCTEIRNATRIIWIGVREIDEGDRQEKEKIIKLLLTFAVAVKRHLRLELGTEWYDLKDHLPEVLKDGYDKEKGTGHDDEIHTIIETSEWSDVNMSLPLVIIFHIGLYVNKKRNVMDGDISENLNSLVDIFGSLVKVCNTPLPFAPNIHLKQAVILYVWILPFALVSLLGWFVIPAITLVGFILFGVEAAGASIEAPFGYDNDELPLDGYIKDLEAEINYIIRHMPSTKETPES